MRRSLAAVLVALAAWPLLAPAADDPPPAPADPETTFTTTVAGTVPDLAGRWLVVAQVSLPQGTGAGIGVASLWEVTTADGAPQLRLRWAKLPEGLERALTAANEAKRAWEPGVEELRELRAGWDRLAPDLRGAATVQTTISGRDDFPEPIKADEDMKDAEFVVQVDINFAPGPARPMRDILFYGATSREPFGWRGNYTSGTIAAAPIPIPIAFKGTFRLYRLEDVPEPTFLERVMGVFAGCGRRAG